MSNYHRRQLGRIHAGERDEDGGNDTSTNNNEISQAYEIRPEHIVRIAATADHAVKDATRKDYRNRLCRMINWCVAQYPQFATTSICQILENDANDTTKHFYNQTHDFMYNKIDPEIIKAFMSTIQTENEDGTGKTRSFSHVRKFHDAILFGACEQRTILPHIYHQEMKKYINSFQKESIQAKRKGNTDEMDADPMQFELYSKLCAWTVDSGDMFAWVYLVILWNCMGRSGSVH